MRSPPTSKVTQEAIEGSIDALVREALRRSGHSPGAARDAVAELLRDSLTRD